MMIHGGGVSRDRFHPDNAVMQIVSGLGSPGKVAIVNDGW